MERWLLGLPSVGNQTGDEIDEKVGRAAVPGVFHLGDILASVKDGPDDETFTRQQLVFKNDESILHIFTKRRDRQRAVCRHQLQSLSEELFKERSELRSINFDRVSVLEPESHPPVPRHGDGVAATALTRQWLQSKPWQVHLLRRTAAVERREDVSQFADVLRSHAARTTAVVERSQPPVLERFERGEKEPKRVLYGAYLNTTGNSVISSTVGSV